MQPIIVDLSNIYCEMIIVPVFLLTRDENVFITEVLMLNVLFDLFIFYSSASRHFSFLSVLSNNDLPDRFVSCEVCLHV